MRLLAGFALLAACFAHPHHRFGGMAKHAHHEHKGRRHGGPPENAPAGAPEEQVSDVMPFPDALVLDKDLEIAALRAEVVMLSEASPEVIRAAHDRLYEVQVQCSAEFVTLCVSAGDVPAEQTTVPEPAVNSLVLAFSLHKMGVVRLRGHEHPRSHPSPPAGGPPSPDAPPQGSGQDGFQGPPPESEDGEKPNKQPVEDEDDRAGRHSHGESPCRKRLIPLGYGIAGDMCLLSNLDKLSEGCQAAITSYSTAAQEGFETEDEGSFEEDNDMHGVIGGVFFLVFFTLLLVFVMKKSYKRRMFHEQMHTIHAAIEANPELKAMVESTAGVALPALPKKNKCARCTCSILRFVGITFLWMTLLPPLVHGIFVMASGEAGEGAQAMGWVLISLPLAAVGFTLIRCGRNKCRRNTERPPAYPMSCPYNPRTSGPGYIALTGSVVSVPSATEDDKEVCTGVPVSSPASRMEEETTTAQANAYNPPSIL